VPERMTTEEGRERARAVLAGAAACVPMHELQERDWPEALAETAVIVTEEMLAPQAIALYQQCKRQRGESGLSPLIVTCAGYDDLLLREWLAPYPYAAAALAAARAAYDTLTAEQFFASRREKLDYDPASMIDEALDDLGRAAGCDPMSILHRLRIGDIAAISEGEGFDPADLLPDDVAAAHAIGLAEREAMLEMSRRRPGPQLMILQQPIRTFDQASALAEIDDGPTRLLLVSAPPAEALLVVGFRGPPPAAHARVWEHWRAAHGAEPFLLDGASLSAVVARPVATREALVRFAAEIVLYDPDALAEGPLELAGLLVRNAGIDFWWD